MRLSANDPNSYSTPESLIIRHIDIDWEVDFTNKKLKGNALLKFDIISNEIDSIVSEL